MKKMKKVLYIGALVGAMGIGAMFGPLLSYADETTVPITFQPRYLNQQDGGMGLRMGQYFAGALQETVAGALGMSAEELYQARLSGKSIKQIAEEKKVSSDVLVNTMLEAKEAQINKLVTDGVITQDQADYMKSNVKANIESAIERTEMGRGMGGQGMRGQGMRGQGRGMGGGFRYNQAPAQQ